MPLPDLIEIVPLSAPVRAEITVPGSKSITNRALILAALAHGTVTLKGALWSEDTQIMVDCLKKLGFEVWVQDDPAEFCNRTIKVQGMGGQILKAGTPEEPLELFVGNAGTAARFLAAFVCLGDGCYRLSGVPRMHERPQAALFQSLRELGYKIEATDDRLPAIITGIGPKPGATGKVSITKSSQFASALLLSAKVGEWQIEVVGENAEESPYVAMTLRLIEKFPDTNGIFEIEPDASSGSYFLAAAWLLINWTGGSPFGSLLFDDRRLKVSHWPTSRWQKDADFGIFVGEEFDLPASISRSGDLADSIMTAIVLAPLKKTIGQPTKFTDLGRLRVQECERVVALRTELTKCGANVIEEGDTLTVHPSPLHGAEIETYHDHRMAMCFAILGLKVPGIKIKNPACVKKTFPNFFQKLAAMPPHGLGAEIWEIKDNQRVRRLTGADLFAD